MDDSIDKSSVEFEVQLPFGPPPVLPDVTKQLKDYLICPERLPIHDYKHCQRFWPRKLNPSALYAPEPSPLGTTLRVERDPTTGRLLQFNEVTLHNISQTSKNSHSLRRAPGALSDGARGSSTNFPFFPGGFEQPLIEELMLEQDSTVDFETDLLEVPPDFSEGISFHKDGKTPCAKSPIEPTTNAMNNISSVVNLMDFVEREQSLVSLWKEEAVDSKKRGTGLEQVITQSLETTTDAKDDEEVDVIPYLRDDMPVLKISQPTGPARVQQLQWAEEIDVSQPVLDFHERLPNLAHTFPFELDTFQKQAILKLEEHANVFVAAHTSAGKTVVAEYAIALSNKHMTRTIYTSPIKALSNQKFRDFKKTFKGIFSDVETDVGLITGDIQINQDASCLIMTTEILRSMLYCGSDVIRDLEYVIFDEVHYINDLERGHVWEEVLILLPQHVSIVMLSATVPNTLEFANWVGGTKQKKMYVISTFKRPVPLKHYLYTGFGGKSKHERFLILDANGKQLLAQGYSEAVAAKKSRESNFKMQFGPKSNSGRQKLSPKQETTLWVGLLDHLSSKDLLPVVAFTLSRNRCDSNSEALTSIDLTSGKQKSHIHHFFQQCLSRLKDPDKELPQIVKMQGLLSRGIGVHHSGILPILREIVEILFQEGFVKLLFATETFAMGVNMPARTVVFDSTRKYDGFEMRPLLPAEYIQMAGRAGRRGIDDTGTVILVCKDAVPELSELQQMMLGKPERLASQFRLTYSMILNLLRVDNITVEAMMSRSFMEVDHRTKVDSSKDEYKKVEEQLKEVTSKLSLNINQEPLVDFYITASEYLDLWMSIGMSILNQKQPMKSLIPGRVVLINHKHHVNKLALILSTEISKKDHTYKVLVLNNDASVKSTEDSNGLPMPAKNTTEESGKKPDIWYKMISCAGTNKLFVPNQFGGHCVVSIPALDIFEITTSTIKVAFDLVLKDWDQRQIPRFSDYPPGKTCNEAIQELARITHSAVSSPQTLQFLDLGAQDMLISDDSMPKKINRLSMLKKQLAQNSCSSMANFEENFYQVFNWKQLENKRNALKFLRSEESMSLYAEYRDRINVLKRLNYIDENCTIQLKGRVACNMSQNELIITELVFRNMLTGLLPAEIAAILSCLVFQQKTRVKPDLTEALTKAEAAIKDLSQEIKDVEREFYIGQQEASRQFESLNFGLVQVVHQWAKGEPFAQIMDLTDVQEGIIVRCMQQLNETLNDVKDAAHMIGDPKLSQMMEDASTAIKRDIVFAASLYTV